jgi:HSP20 family molecular chaperone IbpA
MSLPVRASRRSRGEVARGRVESPTASGWHPDLDVSATDDGWLLVARLPGVTPEEVTVDIGDLDLEIHAVHSDGRPRGVDLDLSYRLAIPAGVDPDAIDATMRDGLLRIRMPRAASSIPAPIPATAREPVGEPAGRNGGDYVDDSVLGPSAESVVVPPEESAPPLGSASLAAAHGTIYRSALSDR